MIGRDAAFHDMSAAADFFGPGSIETPMYQTEILDMVRRRGVLGQRLRNEKATGQPSRYFEQTRIQGGEFQNPRNLSFGTSSDPTRRERYITLKAIAAGISFGIFDVELARQQGQFTQLTSKDLADTVEGVLRTSDLAIWSGSDTDLVVPTTIEYVGLLTQINRTFSIASNVSIIDALKAEVASMMANQAFTVKPTAIYCNPILADLIDQEERLNQRQMPQSVVNEVTGGLIVNALATQAGLLPIIPDWSLPNGAAGESVVESGKTDYKVVILSEALVEYHYLTQAEPRVFVLGLEGNLATRYMIAMFGAPVAKGKANANQVQNVTETNQLTYAHSVGTVVR